MAERVGAVIIGGTLHAEAYAAHLLRRPDMRVVGIAEAPDPDAPLPGRAEAIATALGVPFLLSLDHALATGADLVVAAAEPSRRAGTVRRALEAGRHVLVDKPLAITVEEARSLADLARDRPVVATYVHRCFSPAVLAAHAAVDDGTVGLPRLAHSVFVSFHRYEDAPAARAAMDPRYAGGGEIATFLGYPLDALRYILGLDVVSVFAAATSPTAARDEALGVESHAVVSIELERGVSATIVVGRSTRGTSQTAGRFELTLVGSQGAIRLDESRPSIELYPADGPRIGVAPTDTAGVQAFDALLDDLVEAIRIGRPALRDLDDAAAAVAGIRAAYRSVETRQPVPVEAWKPR